MRQNPGLVIEWATHLLLGLLITYSIVLTDEVAFV